MVLYRPDKEQTDTTLSFAEEISLFPANTPTATLVEFLRPRLASSTCTTDGLAYLADNLNLRPADLRAPQLLLLMSLINEYGGGINDGKIVVNIDPELPTPRQRAKKKRMRRDWRDFGHEPPKLSKQRVGEGVGGGISKLHIWDFKKPRPEQQAGERWTTATTLASLAPPPSTKT